jgi:spore germination protein YaaH
VTCSRVPPLSKRNMKLFILTLFSLLIFVACTEDNSTTYTATETDETFQNDSILSHRHLHEQKYAGMNFNSEKEWDSLNNFTHDPTIQHTGRIHPDVHTFGWHIYSNGSQWKHYNFDMLWGISYFSYSLNPNTGSYKSIHQWKTTAMIDTAQSHNTKIFLTVSNFGSSNNAIFLKNSKAQNTLMDSLSALLAYRNADGINIDFEGVSKASRDNFTKFIIAISKRLKQDNAKYQVSVCLYAEDWNHVFEIDAIDEYVDFYTLMGYDYYGGFSKITGPVTPFNTSRKFGRGLKSSVEQYQDRGVKMDKLIIGLPYYGAEWMTTQPEPGSPVVKFESHPPYKSIRKYYLNRDHIPVQFDSVSASSYLVMKENDTSYRQLFFEDRQSLAIKYDWIKTNKIKGVGFWALGYDDGYSELWNVLKEKFAED